MSDAIIRQEYMVSAHGTTKPAGYLSHTHIMFSSFNLYVLQVPLITLSAFRAPWRDKVERVCHAGS